ALSTTRPRRPDAGRADTAVPAPAPRPARSPPARSGGRAACRSRCRPAGARRRGPRSGCRTARRTADYVASAGFPWRRPGSQPGRAIQGQAVVRQSDFGGHACHPTSMPSDESCDVAHGAAPAETRTRTLVAVFETPVAQHLINFANAVGYRTVLVDPRARIGS